VHAHRCKDDIENVHVTVWKCLDIFRKKLHVAEFSQFPACFEKTARTSCNQLLSHLLADISQTLHSCYGHIEDLHDFLEEFRHFLKNLHVIELSHFSSMF
jgi:hypothetical protein